MGWAWLAIAAIASIDIIWLQATPLSLSQQSRMAIASTLSISALCHIFSRKFDGDNRIGVLLSSASIMLVA